jgi:TolB-like protein/DNA-binding winged helix-turn-helix (wHTH) protein/Tfp pilus assembly protein PilF
LLNSQVGEAIASAPTLAHHSRNARQGLRGGLMPQKYQFGDFTLDQARYRLQRGERLLRLEKLPMELLILLVERRGELVSRDDIADYLWGKNVFLEVDHSINTAVRKIRLALREDPEKPRFVETVVGKGYCFSAPVITNNGATNAAALAELSAQAAPLPSPVDLSPQPGVQPATARSISVRVWILLAGVAALVIFTVALVLYRGRGSNTTSQPPVKSLAVLPLKNLSGDPSQEYLADGMTEELIGRLAAIHDLRVISRTSVMGFRDTKLSVPEIAKTLGVDAFVEGSVIREGNRIRVHAQLIRAGTDEHFWSEEYDRELQDVLALQSEVAQAIAEKVKVSITGQERDRLVAARPVAPEVYESYVKGSNDSQYTKAQIEHRIADFQDAIRMDPTFAPAYVGLAGTYISYQDIFVGAPPSEIRPKATSAARKALELDPKLAEAHAILAEMYQKQWKWAESEAEYKRALVLKPNDASAHRGYAYWLACHGRTQEALSWVERGRELDPLGSADTVGFLLIMAHRYDESIREYRSVLAVHPEYTNARWGLGFALILNHQTDQAIPELEKTVAMMNRSPGSLEMLATAYAHAGRRQDALTLINELEQRRQRGYVPAGAFINPFLALGDYDQAFFWCDEAYKEQSAILQWIKVDPLFDPVRNDARLVDLVHRVGLN